MTRHGKIARLPRAVREKLNERLDNGEAGVRLAKWLNSLPEVKKVLRESFDGHPITPQNVSQWKCGGFCEWQARQEALEQAREMSAQSKELMRATEYMFSDYLAVALAARYAKVLSGWDGKVTEEFSTQLRALRSMCLDVAELRRGDHSRERVALEGRRLHQNRERTEREVYEMFKEWAFQPAVRDCLCQDWETPEEREERLEEIFGLGRVEEGSDGVVEQRDAEEKGPAVEGEKIEVDPSKSKEQTSASAKASDSAEASADKSAERATETIAVDPSKSDQEQARASEGTNRSNGTNRVNKKPLRVSADEQYVGMPGNDLLKKRSNAAGGPKGEDEPRK